MKIMTIFGKVFPSALNALISLGFLSIVLSNSAKADIISGEFECWNIYHGRPIITMTGNNAYSNGSFSLPPYYDYFDDVSLPSPADVSYTEYGSHVYTQSFIVKFDIDNNSHPFTFSSVSGDFSWTNELWIDNKLVYTNHIECLGVDFSLTGTPLAANSSLTGKVLLPHTNDYYVDLMGYLNSGEPSITALWKMVNVTGSLYDTATHNSLDTLYGVSSPYLLLGFEGQVNIAYKYETASGATPEPASMLIFGITVSGAALAGVVRRKRK